MTEPPDPLHKAFEALESGRPQEAAALLRDYLWRDPEDPVVYAGLGVALSQLGDTVSAVEALERAHYLRPQDARILYNYGLVLEAAGRPREARVRFAAALKLDPRLRPCLVPHGPARSGRAADAWTGPGARLRTCRLHTPRFHAGAPAALRRPGLQQRGRRDRGRPRPGGPGTVPSGTRSGPHQGAGVPAGCGTRGLSRRSARALRANGMGGRPGASGSAMRIAAPARRMRRAASSRPASSSLRLRERRWTTAPWRSWPASPGRAGCPGRNGPRGRTAVDAAAPSWADAPTGPSVADPQAGAEVGAEQELGAARRTRAAGGGAQVAHAPDRRHRVRGALALAGGVAALTLGVRRRSQPHQPPPPALQRGHLAGAKLAGNQLAGVNLRGENLSGADLSGANLTGADLAETNLREANLNLSILTRAHLRNADLTRSRLVSARMDGSDLAAPVCRAPQ